MNSEELASIIISRRKSLRVRQEDVAALAGVSLRTIRMVESGQISPRLDTVTKILDVLGLTINIHIG
ncbi:helix-turn-helix domain-containing protein [Spirosoma arcticum]